MKHPDFIADGLAGFQVSVLLLILTVIYVKIVQVVQMVAGSVSHFLDRGMNLSTALTW